MGLYGISIRILSLRLVFLIALIFIDSILGSFIEYSFSLNVSFEPIDKENSAAYALFA